MFKYCIMYIFIFIQRLIDGVPVCLHILQIPECISASSYMTRSDSMQGKWKGLRMQGGVCCTAVMSQTETRNGVFIRCDIAMNSEVPVHLWNVQMSRVTSVRSWKSPLTILILLHQRDFLKSHNTKPILSDIMLQGNPKMKKKSANRSATMMRHNAVLVQELVTRNWSTPVLEQRARQEAV